ncbi:glycoside hydrolase family 16 protein [Coprinopsis sp. MPI-PUGE-AT-0042]|nr:glycoside hydrolase family 16 protein [Coprinopsis sp. MPI-PUGE-AT-0042]
MIKTSLLVAAVSASFTVVNGQAPAYGQCGGQGWSGPTTCESGWTCTKSNDWYSQCLPGNPPPSNTGGATYSIAENISGNGFYNSFDWQNIADPNARTSSTSRNLGLTSVNGNRFTMRADYTTRLSSGGAGRNSVRIKSKRKYSRSVAVFDVYHMPEGCGTWPAIWSTEEDGWPRGGEIDIVEGVNNQGPNAAALHTTSGCSMPSSRDMFGSPGQLDCNYAINSNNGCNVKFPGSPASFGPSFNQAGGGWFAMERSNSAISVWFWPRNSEYVPTDVKSGASSVNPAGWGKPSALFPSNQCNMSQFFSAHNFIINLTLCGDWAGQADVYRNSGCPSTCVDYVNNNPSAFQNAYFDFGGIRIYT